jgi:hydantoinase/carbamoylase family amidase
MPVSAARLQRDIETIARFTATPGAGSDRPTFSAEWAAAVEYVVAEAVAVGCTKRVDTAGNIHLRPASLPASQKAWLSGSHVDSVPHGGDFDGVLGVVAPLEVLRAAKEDGRLSATAAPPLELVIFAEEEGTTFGLGMLGSRTWCGTLDSARLGSVKNKLGQSYLEAGKPCGVDPSLFQVDRFRPGEYRGMIELHIEQGPAMWKREQQVALVTAIAGRRQYRGEFRGTANHAGSTHMGDRRDALACAAEVIAIVEKLAPELGPQVVATVGRIECKPNAVNVIADQVSLSIDFRAPSDDLLERGDAELRRRIAEIAARRGINVEHVQTESLPAAAMDRGVLERLRNAAARLGFVSLPETVSGALHDSAILAPLLPTAMVFVASRDGISHNPAEFSRIDDIAAATRILYETVTSES